jgi:hypothetical protein
MLMNDKLLTSLNAKYLLAWHLYGVTKKNHERHNVSWGLLVVSYKILCSFQMG